MDFSEDSNLLGFSRKKRSAGTSSSSSKENKQDVPLEINLTSKKGGWADEGLKLKSKSKTNVIDQELFKIHNIDDSDDDIPVIPDIEELQDEPVENKSFKSHLASVDKTTYQELDYELSTEGNCPLPQAKLKTKNGDISLSLLTKYLRPKDKIKETDEVWTMDSLWDDICKMEDIK